MKLRRTLDGSFLKLGVPFQGVPIIRTIVFWGILGSILGSPDFGKLPDESILSPPKRFGLQSR